MRSFFWQKFKSKVAIFGGVLLIGIGISWLCEHGVFTFKMLIFLRLDYNQENFIFITRVIEC